MITGFLGFCFSLLSIYAAICSRVAGLLSMVNWPGPVMWISMHIHITGPGQFTIDKRPATLEQIAAYIDSKLKQNPKKPVIIQTDPDVPYYATIQMLDLCKQLRVENVSIPTNSEVAMWAGFAGGVTSK